MQPEVKIKDRQFMIADSIQFRSMTETDSVRFQPIIDSIRFNSGSMTDFFDSDRIIDRSSLLAALENANDFKFWAGVECACASENQARTVPRTNGGGGGGDFFFWGGGKIFLKIEFLCENKILEKIFSPKNLQTWGKFSSTVNSRKFTQNFWGKI